jgi:hypothetical protein
MIVTRRELELHLKRDLDPFLLRLIRFWISVLDEKGVDNIEVEENLQTQVSA